MDQASPIEIVARRFIDVAAGPALAPRRPERIIMMLSDLDQAEPEPKLYCSNMTSKSQHHDRS